MGQKRDGSTSPGNSRNTEDRRTISDFGQQWNRYPDSPGYYGSKDLLRDILEPLLPIEWIAGKIAAEIGSGTGRIVNMLLDAGAAHVTAVEPSSAYDILVANTRARADRVRAIRGPGEALPLDVRFDLIVSIGVLHHIVDPAPVLSRAFEALRPGGRMVVWLYGKEGNEGYVAVVGPLRRLTTRLPDGVLNAIAYVLGAGLALYVPLCRLLPLPMREYARNVLGKLDHRTRRLVVFDQLNPAYTKYFTEEEARSLLQEPGFVDIRCYHRHGYSWTVIGTKPSGETA